MATTFPNIYNHRKVADTSAKPCEVCYRPTTSVLITPENKDFFYSCPTHLKDRAFCSPIVDQEALAAKKKKELDDEIAKVKEEYEAKQKKKKEEEAKKEKDDSKKDTEKDKDKDKDKAEENKKEAGRTDEIPTKEEAAPEPRVFALHRTFYQQRLDKKRQAEMARRNRQRLQDPNFFPSVPTGRP